MHELDIFTEALDRTDPAERAAFLDQACAGNPDLRRRLEELLAGHARGGSPLDRPPVASAEADATADLTTPIATGEHRPDRATEAFAYTDPDAAGPDREVSAPSELATEESRADGATEMIAHTDLNAITAAASGASVPRAQRAPAGEGIGTVIAGRYTLVEVIGEGGMGSVYLANQTEPVKRQVALKLIKTGMDSRGVLARFDAERQALALMDHPNIARIYDGGLTPAGQPFFVMELVQGVPLAEYCDQNRLSVHARLELFVSVCQAVQHAHQKGIIHRDLKPGNVLVTEVDGRPTPKVIDFGVAKATDMKLTDMSLADIGAIVGTPAYMSPEQADATSMDIDTRTDVYALGVMLYELLTGSPPIDARQFQRGAILEMLRMVREVDPPRPSTKLSTAEALPNIAANRSIEPARLAKLLHGELDWVVMKALEKDRNQRYDTANGFARDIQRYLADEVVEARPPSRGYRLKKFVKRNKGQVIAASLVLLTLLGGIIGTSIGLVRADRARAAEAAQRRIAEDQRKKAEKARDRTRDVLDAMTSSATGDSLSTQKEISADQKKFLTEVLTYYKEFAGEKADDEQSRLRTASAAFRVGSIEYRLGRTEQGNAAFKMARDAYRTLATDFPTVPSYRQELALSHHNLGYHLNGLGKRTEAEAEFRQALALQAKLAADLPSVPVYRREQAYGQNSLGALLAALGKPKEAEEQFRQALAIQERLTVDFPVVAVYRQDLAGSHNNLGLVLDGLGKRTDAEEQYRRGLTIQAKLAAAFPAVPEYRLALVYCHNNLGILLNSLGKAAEALEQFRRALEVSEKLAADFPAVPAYRQVLAVSHHNAGGPLGRLGKLAEAEEQYRRAMAIREKLTDEFPTSPSYRRDLASSQNDLGLLLAGLGKRAEAEELYRKALAIKEKLATDFPTVPEYRQDLAGAHNNLGMVLDELGKRTDAEGQYRQAMVIQEKLAADFPAVSSYQIRLGANYCNYGVLLASGRQPAESLVWYDKAIATLAPVHRAEPRDFTAKQFLINSLTNRAIDYAALTKHAEAIEDFDRAIDLSPPAEQLELRARRAISRLESGMVQQAVADVDELTRSSNLNAEHWYNFACVYAVASGKIADKKQEYVERAMKSLQNAVKAGFNDAAHMKQDTDLAPLRGRDEFQKLLAELEAKAGKK